MHYSWQRDNWNQLQVHHRLGMVRLKTFSALDRVSDIADPNWVLDLKNELIQSADYGKFEKWLAFEKNFYPIKIKNKNKVIRRSNLRHF